MQGGWFGSFVIHWGESSGRELSLGHAVLNVIVVKEKTERGWVQKGQEWVSKWVDGGTETGWLNKVGYRLNTRGLEAE